MNKEQIIDEAYENYRKTILTEFFENTKELRKWAAVEGPGGYNKEEFINKCKTDSEFSEKWKLKIEERELSLEEELEYMMGKVFSEEALTHQVNTPTRLITITYKDATIESYE